MEAHMREPEFKARVGCLDSALPRGKQLGAVLLAVADAMDWTDEAEAIIAGYVAERKEELSEAEREVLAEIVRERLDVAKDGVLLLPSGETLGTLNQRLKDRGLNTVSARRWKALRAAFSIGDVRRSGGIMLTFGPEAMKALGLEPTNAEIAEAYGLAPSKESFGGDRLRGAKNIMAISDHIRTKLRWDGARPDSWIARDAVSTLQLPQDPESLAELERFVEAIRREG